MKCGQAIFVKDIWSTYRVRFIALCEGRFLLVTSDATDARNGMMLVDWLAVLRELVALTMPEKMTERICTAEAVGTGQYVSVKLAYPLSAAGLAALLDVDAGAVRALLADWAVQFDAV